MGQKQNIMEEIGERSDIIFLNNLIRKLRCSSKYKREDYPLEGQNALMVYGNPETFKEIEKLVKSIDIQINNR